MKIFSLPPGRGFCGKMKNTSANNSVTKPHRQSAQAETDQFTPLQLSLQSFGLSSNQCFKWKKINAGTPLTHLLA